MTLPELPEPILVEDQAALGAMLRELEGEREIAVDTEADSFFSYREKVCLVQISAGDRDWIVDPLAGLDLAPLGGLLADPERTKVFHDGEYDILILKRDFGFDFRNLFDTRVAAAALGTETPGLASVLRDNFGYELDKTQQRSDWSRRPLTAKQIHYAQLDTRFLVPLMHLQRKQLAEAERLMVVESECERLVRIEPPDTSFDPDEWVRLRGARTLPPAGRSALRELFIERDRIAREVDVPPFRAVRNDVLVAIARRRPRNVRELGQIPGFSPGQVRRHGERLLAALERAREAGPIETLPRLSGRDGNAGLDETGIELHDRLKAWRKEQAAEFGFDASLVLNRHLLASIARERPRRLEDLERIGLAGWQVERFGRELLDLVRRFERDVAEGRVPGQRRRRRG